MNTIATLDKAKTLLAEARSFDDIKKIKDISTAAKAYAKAHGLGKEAVNYANEMILLAERKLGQMLKETPRNRGGNPKLTCTNSVQVATIPQMGFTRKESARAQFVADLPQEKFDLVTTGKQSLGQVYREVRNIERGKILRSKPLPEGRFQVILADPPWEYRNSGFESSAENKYPTMPIQKIKELPICSMADENSVLFLWATNPLLKEALEVIASWGFEYKTNIAWIKERGTGIGFYVTGWHELLLIATRGSMLPIGSKPKSILTGRSSRHSEKPEEAFRIIETMYPRLEMVELFQRKPRIGWAGWGNEI